MTLLLTLSCDGKRDRNPCRGARSVGPIDWDEPARAVARAQAAAAAAGWRAYPDGPLSAHLHLCPGGGHDEDPPEDP